MKKIAILTFTIILAISCENDSNKHKDFASQSEASTSSTTSNIIGLSEDLDISPPQSRSPEQPPEPVMEKGSKIIKNGNMRIEADNITSSKSYIDSIVAINKGYYEKEVFYNSDYRENYALKLRIPSANFYTVVNSLEKGSGTILEKNINAKDVTEEYLDLEIRLENNKAYLKRYKELLSKAKSIKDMIQIQEKIRQIEMLVDGNMGKINYLNDRASFSSLSIELTKIPEEIIAEAPPSYFNELFDALENGFSGLLFFILLLVNLWPILLGFIIIWMLRIRMFGFLRKKRKVSST